MNNVKTQIARKGYSPTQLVNVCNVGIHVVNIVSVGWVLDNVPLVWLGALSAEHVATVLGLVIHTVKACNLKSAENRYTYIYIYI